MAKSPYQLAVLVAALGFFVDVYDIILFAVVRVPSLTSLGARGAELTSLGLELLNWQLMGMLVGGFVWGVLGDRRGRLSVLFGSILIYSAANLLNAFVVNIDQYRALRLLAGFGLAGELGAGVTLVSELLPTHKRGYGPMIIASVGMSGGIFAGIVGEHAHWKTAYIIGGAMGLALLVLRVSVSESAMFQSVTRTAISRGDLCMLFRHPSLFKRYLACLCVGMPLWMCTLLISPLTPEISAALLVSGKVTAAKAFMYLNIGIGSGDISSSLVSQWCKSRKKAVAAYLGCLTLVSSIYFSATGASAGQMYALYVALGFCCGYLAVFLTMSAEQFGTNFRATATTSLPNIIRGLIVPLTWCFGMLRGPLGVTTSLRWMLLTALVVAFVALATLRETFSSELDFTEGG